MRITSQRSAFFSSTVVALGLAVVLTGCASTPGPVSTVPVPSASPSAGVIESPLPAVDPPVDPTVEPVTCDTMLTPAAMQDLAGSNLVPRDFTPSDGDYPLVVTIDTDGIVCLWGNQGDVRQVMGEMAMEPSVWESTRAQLLTEGFVQEDDVVEGFMNGPDAAGDDFVNRGFAYRDGTVYYTSYSKFFTSFASFTD